MSPPLPFVADPVVSLIAPDEPPLVVPEVNESSPLTPDAPALAVFTRIEPLDLVVPCIALRLIVPPVSSFVLPELIDISPPSDVVPVPTLTIMLPARPVLALPVAINTLPLDPELVVPVKNDMEPLTPLTPALTVCMRMDPLEVAVP